LVLENEKADDLFVNIRVLEDPLVLIELLLGHK